MREVIITIDKITANVAFIALFIVLAKFITKRMGRKKLDIRLMKIHRPATNVLVVTSIIHMFTSFVYLNELGIIPFILGFISLASIIVAALTFTKRKIFGRKWLFYHRVFSLISLITLLAHIAIAVD